MFEAYLRHKYEARWSHDTTQGMEAMKVFPLVFYTIREISF